MKKVIIIEDHPIVVFNLKLGLHGYQDVEVVETHSSGTSLMSSTVLDTIDVALLDINLPDMNGFEICKFLKTNYPSIKIIGISSFEDYEHISMMLENGADGYIVKGAKNSEMLEAISLVLEGEQYFCSTAQHALNMKALVGNKEVQLTKRERKLIELTNTKPCLDFISKHLGEDKDSTAAFLELLREKIRFYNLDIHFSIPQEITCNTYN